LLRLNNIKILYSIVFVFSLATNAHAQTEDENVIDVLIDQWHHAASVADEDVFFGFMTEECIYIGTDITEKWKRDELKTWSAKFFDKESAWSFTAFEREIYFNENTAWFDEKLNTWMGECRGSGVLIKTKEGWKLTHYHLSVTIPNDKIQGFIDLVKED